MDALLSQLRGMALSADDLTRVKLATTLTELQAAIETPIMTMFRLLHSMLQVTALRSLGDIGAVKALAAVSPPGLSTTELAATCKVPEHWLVPLLRVVAAGGLVDETGPNRFAANKITTVLAQENDEGAARFLCDSMIPILASLPEYLKESGYKPSTEAPRSLFQHALKTDTEFFPYMAERPERLRDFQWMMTGIEAAADWLDVFPFEAEAKGWQNAEKPLLVDIGGGFGTQCRLLLDKHPQAKGKIVLQDTKETVDKAPEISGVQIMAHDFLTPQPIKGARFYYFRFVLHNWPDDKVMLILRNIRESMDPGSKLLIDETVVPDQGVFWMASLMDVIMRALFRAPTRSESDWRRLLRDSGLKVEQILTYSAGRSLAVIVASPA